MAARTVDAITVEMFGTMDLELLRRQVIIEALRDQVARQAAEIAQLKQQLSEGVPPVKPS